MKAVRDRWAFASLATLLYWVAHQALRPFVALRLDQLGADAARVGLAVSLHALVPFVLAIPLGRLSDRFGLRRLLLASIVVMAASGALYPLASAAEQIAVLEGVNGVGTMGVWICLQSLVTHAGSGETLRRHLALFSLAWGVGLASGPTVGGLLFDYLGFEVLCAAYAAAAVLTLGAVALVPFRGVGAVANEARARFTSQMREILARGPVQGVLLSSFVMLYVQSIRQSFYPLFLEQQGMPVSQIGLLLTVIGLSSVAVRTVTVWVTRQVGARAVLVLSSALSVIGMAATPWLGTWPLLVVGAVLVGVGQGLNAPVTVELMAAYTMTDERGLGMALRAMANRLAGIVQPLLFGALGSAFGLASGFSTSGVLLAGLTVGVWRASKEAHGLEEPA